MEAREQNVEVSLRPEVTIKGQPLDECTTEEIAREIMALCKDLQNMREQLMKMREFIGDQSIEEVRREQEDADKEKA